MCAVEYNCADESIILHEEGRYFPLKVLNCVGGKRTTDYFRQKCSILYLNWTYFIQKAISNLDCQKKTFNELLIVLVSRMGWQRRYETAKKDIIVSLLLPV